MRRLEDVRQLHLLHAQAYGAALPVHAWLVGDPWPELPPVEAAVNTHLHFDRCGGNRRFAGLPTDVQRAELD